MGGKTAVNASLLGKIRAFKSAVAKKYGVEKIVLFGSQATGKATAESDVDLMLVSKKFEGQSSLKRPVPFYLEWSYDQPADFVCYTPAEFARLSKKATLVKWALENGIIA